MSEAVGGFCTSCGAPLAADDVFCGRCGARAVRHAGETIAPATVESGDVSPDEPPTATIDSQTEARLVRAEVPDVIRVDAGTGVDAWGAPELESATGELDTGALEVHGTRRRRFAWSWLVGTIGLVAVVVAGALFIGNGDPKGDPADEFHVAVALADGEVFVSRHFASIPVYRALSRDGRLPDQTVTTLP